MNMPECKKCGKSFKSERGVKIHESQCVAEATPETVSEPEKEPSQQARSSAVIDRKITKTVQAVKEHLDKQPKTMFYVPLSPGEKEGAYETVQINGYTMQIKKGVSVELPQQVVEMLANKYRVQVEAGKDMRMNEEKRDFLT